MRGQLHGVALVFSLSALYSTAMLSLAFVYFSALPAAGLVAVAQPSSFVLRVAGVVLCGRVRVLV